MITAISSPGAPITFSTIVSSACKHAPTAKTKQVPDNLSLLGLQKIYMFCRLQQNASKSRTSNNYRTYQGQQCNSLFLRMISLVLLEFVRLLILLHCRFISCFCRDKCLDSLNISCCCGAVVVSCCCVAGFLSLYV